MLAPPDAFLALAAGGTALRAAASAIAKPAHTVVLAHLATPGVSSLGTRRAANLGSVSAKEEAQEVAANLSGLLLSLVFLQLLGGGAGGETQPQTLALAWAGTSASHFALR